MDDDYDLLGTPQEARVSPVFASEKYPAKKTATNQETREQEKQLWLRCIYYDKRWK